MYSRSLENLCEDRLVKVVANKLSMDWERGWWGECLLLKYKLDSEIVSVWNGGRR